MIVPPYFPARPVNGGPLPKALPKSGEWSMEAKYNGWRAWVHNPTGTMFNRYLQPLSINGEFTQALETLKHMPWEWSDVEALERRHKIGRGSLILLDCLSSDPKHDYKFRKKFISFCTSLSNAAGKTKIEVHEQLNRPIENERVYLPFVWDWHGAEPRPGCIGLWQLLQQYNQSLGCEFFEGLVAKRNDSLYPRQKRSAEQEFPFWMKHRWDF